VHPERARSFSRWSHDKKTPIGLGHVRRRRTGLCESAGYEGEFCSVRRPFAWTKGTYTYSVIKADAEMIDGKPHTWFHCVVRSHETGASTYVGSLRFEGDDFTFWARTPRSSKCIPPRKFRSPAFQKSRSLSVIRASTARTGNSKMPSSIICFPERRPAAMREPARTDGSSVTVEVGPIFVRDKAQARQTLELKVNASGGRAGEEVDARLQKLARLL